MPAYYDWLANSLGVVPSYRNPGSLGSAWMRNGAQTAGPADVDMSANANSTPVQLMAKFVNSRGWGAPMPAQGMYDWRGNTIGKPANTPAQAQGGGDNMRNEPWDALAWLVRKR